MTYRLFEPEARFGLARCLWDRARVERDARAAAARALSQRMRFVFTYGRTLLEIRECPCGAFTWDHYPGELVPHTPRCRAFGPPSFGPCNGWDSDA